MDLRRLELLVDLSRLGSMRAVAHEHATTTSTVSQQLAALARDVDATLLEPDGRRVRLTPAGRRLAERAVRILAEVESARSELDPHAEPTGTVRVGGFGRPCAAPPCPPSRRCARAHRACASSSRSASRPRPTSCCSTTTSTSRSPTTTRWPRRACRPGSSPTRCGRRGGVSPCPPRTRTSAWPISATGRGSPTRATPPTRSPSDSSAGSPGSPPRHPPHGQPRPRVRPRARRPRRRAGPAVVPAACRRRPRHPRPPVEMTAYAVHQEGRDVWLPFAPSSTPSARPHELLQAAPRSAGRTSCCG